MFYPYFPPNTKVYLYYSMSPEKSRFAGGLRLRVTSSDSASFESGSDLLRTNGQPWSRPIYNLSKFHVALYEKTEGRWTYSGRLGQSFVGFALTKIQLLPESHLYALNDTFILDFSSYSRFASSLPNKLWRV